LILRFLALYEDHKSYRRPMAEFLNIFAKKNRNPTPQRLTEFVNLFSRTITVALQALGQRAFRPKNAINAAIYDSVMVGIARRLERGPIEETTAIKTAYEGLLDQQTYKDATSRATADNAAVAVRIEEATEFFNKVI